MSIQLFEHNRLAYEAVVAKLQETGKAAVVHPTGTGKSFIGFKLCADHPDKCICWLSPSEYIFKTQLENLEKAAKGYKPKNIVFFTYAKLMLQSDEDNRSLRPDYIILDEFHRCGAQMWGQGVERLLKVYPEVPILGLSATAIRYLDNQRNMVDELFEGHVASNLTLGEAIVRGILKPPKYVLSVYSYQKDLERYEKRVRSCKNCVTRNVAQQYLDALRRKLEKADGLDEIFARHMKDPAGKYIVFCSSLSHVRDMINKCHQWFGRVDPSPRVYVAYSNDPETDRAFALFKKDQSMHLKLLFCIDMLNEGVHVDDVDGVILLRPTVSPIVYKQQIGRALCAGGEKEPVIFDIVLNIENLYNIGAIEEEMMVAITYYRDLGLGNEIVNERFKVIDEVRDCLEVFEKLNETLAASWDQMYEEAKEYYKQVGDLEIPRRYVTAKGYALGSWLCTQRKVYSGKQNGVLSKEQIIRLNEIGMRWGAATDVSWNRHLEAAKRYYAEHGDLMIPSDYVDGYGVKLGSWISNLRTMQKNGIRSAYLSPERQAMLEDMGMVWNVSDHLWDRYYCATKEYYDKNGTLDIPLNYVDSQGIRLGIWINGIRTKKKQGKLSVEQTIELERLGLVWENKYDLHWEKMYQGVRDYKLRFGDLNIPSQYKNKAGHALGKWIRTQREEQAKGKLSPYRKNRLDELGMHWEIEDSWEKRYALASEFYGRYGNLNIPASYKVEGICLNKWLSEQRQIYYGNRPGKCLTEEQIHRLEEIGMIWQGQRERRANQTWDRMYTEACQYYRNNGSLKVPSDYLTADGKKLAVWLTHQRKKYKDSKLTGDQIRKLDSIGAISAVAG